MSKDRSLQKWLDIPKAVYCQGRRRAVIYDFDGTLFRSPDREAGELVYLEATGKEWPHQGWWGRVETLLPPIVPDPIPAEMLIQEVADAHKQDWADKNTWVVLMTGRPVKCRRRVGEILSTFQIEFDEEYFRGMKGLPQGSDTFDIKLDLIKTRILHDKLETLEIWEDRPEHSSRFMTEARRFKATYRKTLDKVIIHDVPSGQHHEF